MKYPLPALAIALGLTACTIPAKPRRAVERSGTTINASASRTWDAVISLYGDNNMPIRSSDPSAGVIVGDAANITDRFANGDWYDCGSGIQGTNPARRAFYNAVVRGDSAHSTIEVAARWQTWVGGKVANELKGPVQGGWDPARWKSWVGGDAEHTWECTTQGGWESSFEAEVKARAEAR